MQLKRLIQDDDGVSPVIGVILMVAITVILAAVIATFVLGLGEQLSDSSPQATFDFDYDGSSTLTVTHVGGDSIEAGDLYLRGSSNVNEKAWTDPAEYSATNDIGAGDDIDYNVNDDDTVRVVWESADGEQTATLQIWEGPQA
jgi:flagellin-like protein